MKKMKELDGLRGFLAVWVVFVHLLPAAGFDTHNSGIFAPLFGELVRVQIFCIMSGFVIFLMLEKSKDGYPVYIYRRVMRLYPVYLVAFVLSVASAWIAYDALLHADFTSARNVARLAIFDEAFDRWPEHIAAHLFMVHGLIPYSSLPSAAYTFLGQAWNISTEFQFYVVAPLLFWGITNRNIVVRVAFVLLACVLWWLTRYWPNSAALPYYAKYFLLGIGSYYAWKLDWSGRVYASKISLAVLAIIICYFNIAAGIWIYIFGSALLVRDKKAKAGLVSAFLTTPVMTWLGGISYCLYLLHMIPLYLFMQMINGRGLGQYEYLFALAFLTLFSAVLMSYLCSRFIEQRFYRSRVSTSAAKSVTAPALANGELRPLRSTP